jgi:FKBP-type peptidyl-prolyl cis-trans isomerase SlpA
MKINERKTITISKRKLMANLEDLIQEVDKSQLPEDITPEVGMGLVSKSADGNEMNLLIVEVKEATIVIDGNHPLAGKELTFDLEVVDIQE